MLNKIVLYFSIANIIAIKMDKEITGFREAVNDIVQAFSKNRITRYAHSHNCNKEDLHVHNQIPLNILVKEFRSSNNIRIKKYENLSPEQKDAWVKFYNTNKILMFMTNDEHKTFHETMNFDDKTKQWYSSKTEEQLPKKSSLTSMNETTSPTVRIEIPENDNKEHRKSFDERTQQANGGKSAIRRKSLAVIGGSTTPQLTINSNKKIHINSTPADAEKKVPVPVRPLKVPRISKSVTPTTE